MAFTPEKHQQADALRASIDTIQKKISEFQGLILKIDGKEKVELSLLYTGNEETLRINVADSETSGKLLVNDLIAELEDELTTLQNQYNNICD